MTSEAVDEVFWEVMRGLPRQGVGSDTDTARALALCTDLPVAPRILDIGCGPGRQSLVLARATGGHVTAVDLHAPFLDELRANAASAGLSDRITTVQADMRELPFEAGTFDLIWSEGAAYAMGVAAALVAWRQLLRPGGYLGYSELVWTDADPPGESVDFFAIGLSRHDRRCGQPGAHRRGRTTTCGPLPAARVGVVGRVLHAARGEAAGPSPALPG